MHLHPLIRAWHRRPSEDPTEQRNASEGLAGPTCQTALPTTTFSITQKPSDPRHGRTMIVNAKAAPTDADAECISM
jgi:hypothetical protein